MFPKNVCAIGQKSGENMPRDAQGLLCSRRFYDYPMRGSIYRLPDDPRLIRGPTLVKMDDGKDIRVPANFKADIKSGAQTHDDKANDGVMQQLMQMMQGRKPTGPKAQKGFGLELPGFANPMPGRGQNLPRQGGMLGGGRHGHF